MASWTEGQKVKIRHFMGSGNLNGYGACPPLEDAMSRVLAQADGGAQADDSTQLAIIATLAELDDINTKRQALRKRIMVDTAKAGGTEARLDPARGIAALCAEGRRVAGGLARYLGFTAVLRDVFSAAAPDIPPIVGQNFYSS